MTAIPTRMALSILYTKGNEEEEKTAEELLQLFAQMVEHTTFDYVLYTPAENLRIEESEDPKGFGNR